MPPDLPVVTHYDSRVVIQFGIFRISTTQSHRIFLSESIAELVFSAAGGVSLFFAVWIHAEKGQFFWAEVRKKFLLRKLCAFLFFYVDVVR